MATQSQEPGVPAVKVTRRRKRLYEQVEEGTPQLPAIVSQETSIKPLYSPSKAREAEDIILDSVLWTAGVSVIPVPFVDMLAIGAVKVKMLYKLCQLYELEFKEQRVKTLIASLVGALQVKLLSRILWKFIPGIGQAGGIISTAVIAGAITYALGKVFVLHFETGGTLLDFNPSAMQAYFIAKYKEGQALTATLKN